MKKTMNKLMLMACAILFAPLAPAQPSPAPPATSRALAPAPQIAGIAMEVRSGTPDVVVALFDQQTGLPISARTRRPIFNGKPSEAQSAKNMEDAVNILTATTDARGGFAFSNLPSGRYRLVAQKWIGPFKGLFELQGSVIQLFGSAENVQIPSQKALHVVLTPPGRGVLQLDQDAPNDGTLLLLSAAPPEYDPILGFHCLGQPFLKNLMGMNRMPSGRTTIIGLPPGPVHAFFFAADNSPGYATQTYTPQLASPAPKIPFVAGWSDGRHDPPEDLKKLMEQMEKENIYLEKLLGLTTKDGKPDRAALAAQPLDRRFMLPDGSSHRLGDLLAADAYRRLGQYRQKVEEGKR